MKASRSALGYVRIGTAVPQLKVADINYNLEEIHKSLLEAEKENCQWLLFPELCLSGYTCGDLFFQSHLIQECSKALLKLKELSSKLNCASIIGLPLSVNDRLYNVAAAIHAGKILGFIPKVFLPNRNEFYEQRWFSSGNTLAIDILDFGGTDIPIGTDLLFDSLGTPSYRIAIELCEDLWSTIPPSSQKAIQGAHIIFNPSASDEVLGKNEYRKQLISQQSARCLAAYAYSSAGCGESTTDVVYSGAAYLYENGHMLGEGKRFQRKSQLLIRDIDIDYLKHERLKNSSFNQNEIRMPARIFQMAKPNTNETNTPLKRPCYPKTPFVPSNPQKRSQHCEEIFAIQSTGLSTRMAYVGNTKAVIGLSGGLDSTLALLVTVKAFEILGRKLSDIEAVTMPGLGTTQRTRNNASKLAQLLGVNLRTISINRAVRQHFRDIGHEESQYNVTYENSQARERTQILMDIANQIGGIVIGTGDLSELALGWCTYNGDHMSMYAVNSGVPKTLVRYLVDWVAESQSNTKVKKVLKDICATPITPELLPLSDQKELQQKTEDTIGPYELHDFFLFHFLRHGFSPLKIYTLACESFAEDYRADQILEWLKLFYRRFFSSQFKRSAIPDGPKVGSVALSPRGDWRMPSDASAQCWLKELEEL